MHRIFCDIAKSVSPNWAVLDAAYSSGKRELVRNYGQKCWKLGVDDDSSELMYKHR